MTSGSAVAGKITKGTIDLKEYRTLVGRSLAHVIRNEEENEHYIGVLESLDAQEDPTPAERELAELLTVLIENFEEEHYKLRRAKPKETLAELMAANNLKQRDLVDIFGAPSIVSEVLSGKRNLTVDHIRRLAERFHVSPEVFF
jgi:HTH-type transcriptional regulator/antitoxin HigA